MCCGCALTLAGTTASAEEVALRATERGYAREGVLEAGGAAGMMISDDFRSVNVSPSFGWFVSDGVQITTILGLTNIESGDDTATMVTALVEPSYHLGLGNAVYAFAGVGGGVAFVGDFGGGLAVAPRVGVKVPVGAAGILTPSVSYEYVINSFDEAEMQDVALDAAVSSVRVNLGYTAMW